MTYSYIKTCDILAGGEKLILRAPDDMTYEIVSKRKTLDAVAETLAVLGRPHRVSAELGRAAEAPARRASRLGQWPVQIKLVPVNAPYFDGAKLLIAADCAAYALSLIHIFPR